MGNTPPDFVSPAISIAVPKRRQSVWLIAIIILFVVGSGAAGYYFFRTQTSDMSQTVVPQKPTDPSEIGNPFQYFYKNFSAKDYKVVVVDRRNEGPGGVFEGAIEKGTYYYQKGILVRRDSVVNGSNDTSTIIKNGKVVVLSHSTQEFLELGADDAQAVSLLASLKSGSPIDLLLQGETPLAPPWEPVEKDEAGTLGFQTKNRHTVPTPTLQDVAIVDYQIFLDPVTGLLNSVTMKVKTMGIEYATTTTLKYEEVEDIELLKRFPIDYKKKTNDF